MIVTQISAELVLTIWSDETARPTVAATSATAGSAVSCCDVCAASRSSSGSDIPGAPVQRITRFRSWNCGWPGWTTASTAAAPRPARPSVTRHEAAASQRGARWTPRSVAWYAREARLARPLGARRRPRPSSMAARAGVTVSATSVEAATQSMNASTIGRRKVPVSPGMRATGAAAASTASAAAHSGPRSSPQAATTPRRGVPGGMGGGTPRARGGLGGSSPRASTVAVPAASAATTPSASSRPSVTSALNVYPSRYSSTVPAVSEIAVAVSATTASRRFSSSASSASAASTAAAISARLRLCSELSM